MPTKTATTPGLPLGPFQLIRETDGDYRHAVVTLDGELVAETNWEWRPHLFRRQLHNLLIDIQRTFFPSEPRLTAFASNRAVYGS